jgi:magnesium transporter
MRLSALLGPDIKALLREDPEQIAELLEEIHPEDLADIVSTLEPEEAALILARMPAEDAAPIFERLEEHEQEEIVEQMPPESVALIASEMEADDRADLISALPEEVGTELLANLQKVDPEAAEEVREIAVWPEASAGRLMTTEFVSVAPTATVADALVAVKRFATERPGFAYGVYALEQERLVGVASLRDLLTAEPTERMTDVMRSNVISVPPTLHQEEVARVLAKYDLNAIPVINDKSELLGIITVDDVIDVLVAEQTEDVQRLGGVEPLDESYFQTTFVSFIRKRAGWLVVLFVGEFFTQTALRHYDEVLSAIHQAAYYVPLLISAGGNSGSQSSSLIIRGLAVGDVKPGDWWRVLYRELGMGLVLGLIVGLLGFLRVIILRDQSPLFAVTIGLTLVGIIIVGCTVGSMLPILLKRVGLDPATSSTPFIASLVDVLGIVVFVKVAQYVMAEVIASGLAATAVP